MLSLQNFKDFEVFSNETARASNLDFQDGICVIQRHPVSEFGDFSGIQLKKTYLVNRLIECSVANLSKYLSVPAFKLVSGDVNTFVFVNDPKKTKLFNGKLYLAFKVKQNLEAKYNADKVFTLNTSELNSMYRDDPEHLEKIKNVWI